MRVRHRDQLGERAVAAILLARDPEHAAVVAQVDLARAGSAGTHRTRSVESNVTRSPDRPAATPGPSAAIVPAASCPMIDGRPPATGATRPCRARRCRRCRRPHADQHFVGPATGSGTSSTTNRWYSFMTSAFMSVLPAARTEWSAGLPAARRRGRRARSVSSSISTRSRWTRRAGAWRRDLGVREPRRVHVDLGPLQDEREDVGLPLVVHPEARRPEAREQLVGVPRLPQQPAERAVVGDAVTALRRDHDRPARPGDPGGRAHSLDRLVEVQVERPSRSSW